MVSYVFLPVSFGGSSSSGFWQISFLFFLRIQSKQRSMTLSKASCLLGKTLTEAAAACTGLLLQPLAGIAVSDASLNGAGANRFFI
jgi:hypothetical protein